MILVPYHRGIEELEGKRNLVTRSSVLYPALKEAAYGASLVAQCLRICLPSLDGREVGGEQVHVYVHETLHYLPENCHKVYKVRKEKEGICLPMQEMLVPFLVGELRSDMPWGY